MLENEVSNFDSNKESFIDLKSTSDNSNPYNTNANMTYNESEGLQNQLTIEENEISQFKKVLKEKNEIQKKYNAEDKDGYIICETDEIINFINSL